jgi:hypothetical protein
MVFTSDQAFWDRIGEKETKRYFNECYNFRGKILSKDI